MLTTEELLEEAAEQEAANLVICLPSSKQVERLKECLNDFKNDTIRYFRKIVIDAVVPSVWFHLLMAADALIALGIGCWMYKRNNTKILYYV